jgi:hypothetical protein
VSDPGNAAREARLKWLVFGGLTAAILLMAVVFIVVGQLAG